jgi:hypothetical protein
MTQNNRQDGRVTRVSLDVVHRERREREREGGREGGDVFD